MNHLLFDHHGAFVLFGSKPISEAVLTPSMTEEQALKIFASLPDEMKKEFKMVQHPYEAYDCWKTWKKYQDQFPMKDFVIAERPLKIDPSCIDVYLVNKKSTEKILKQHYPLFCEIFGQEFDPKMEVENISDPSSCFWNCILADKIALGILFGYGEKNAKTFVESLKKGHFPENFDFSTSDKIQTCEATRHNFAIPIFRTFEDEKIVEIYKREKKKIEKIYENEDSLEITLKKLAS